MEDNERYGGRYQILEEIGRSQIAVVHRAFDARLDREVAIKIVMPNRDLSEDFRDSFFRAVKELAGLSHANILKVLDYGSQQGSPYLVMDYISGGSLQKKMSKAIDWREAFRLLMPVADALRYGHEHGVLHRDLKPSNILIDSQGQPLVTDFGVVTIVETEETRDATSTTVGLGMPEYMSPEQGSGLKVGASGDIYTLGIILYEMLTCQKPFVADSAMEVVIKQVTAPPPNPRKTVKGLPIDVAQIVMRMLQKKPAERFRNMQEVIDAMDRALHRHSQGGRSMPSWVIGAMGLVVMAITVITVMVILPRAHALVATPSTLPMTLAADLEKKVIATQSPTKPAPTSTPAPTSVPTTLPTIGIKRFPGLPGREPFPTEIISVTELGRLVEITRLGGGKTFDLEWLPDGQQLLAGTSTGFYYYDAANYQLVDFFDALGVVAAFDVDRDNQRIAAGYPDGMLRVWDAQTFRLLFEVDAHSPANVTSVRFSPNGSKILTTGHNHKAALWDALQGRKLADLTGHQLPVTTGDFTPDGKQVVTGSEDFRLIFWDAATGANLRAVAGPAVINHLVVSPDGTQLATALRNATVQIWDVKSGELLRTLKDAKLVSPVNSLAYTSNGTLLAAGANDGTVRLWNVAKGQSLKTMSVVTPATASPRAEDAVIEVLFSPKEDHLMAQTAGGALRGWVLSGDYELDQQIDFSTSEVRKVAISSTGRYFAAQFGEREAHVWDAKTFEMHKFSGAILQGEPFSPDEKQIALALINNHIGMYDVDTTTIVFDLQGYSGTRSINYLSGGKILGTGGFRQISLWSTASGKELSLPKSTINGLCETASDDQNELIGAGSTIGIIDNVQAVNNLCALTLDARTLTADFLPGGEMAAFGLANNIVILWKANNGQPQQFFLNSHTGSVQAVAFSPDGTLLATGGEDQTVMLWETATGQFLRTLSGQNGAVLGLKFSHDGSLLLVGSADGALHIWGMEP